MSTKIRLYWRTGLDRRHLASGVHVRIIRLYVPVSFSEPTGWSRPYDAVIDTGSPLTVIPKNVWQTIQIVQHLSDLVPLGGVGKGVLWARLAKIELALLGTRKEMVQLAIKAYLAEDDTVPLLLGVEDLLTNARLVCDYSQRKAFLQATPVELRPYRVA
ncbi:MAG: hypothetical protein ONB44_10845 [candidate division KSB1 bacterium]|nr:hypothetical protein [candidate division KSB1 bacterium]MDZ7302621.1 hypothetical protein [candidate division KSB1 bacterium]MDZ7311539.1 hypothetical protein [candidate division KSB1 bacterium]